MLIVVIIAVRDTAINGSYCAIRTSDVCRSQPVDSVAQLSATKFDWDCATAVGRSDVDLYKLKCN